MFRKLIDRIVRRALDRAQREENLGSVQLRSTSDVPPPTGLAKSFTIHEALNGHYIEYMRRRYNPTGPDDYAREIYIVQPNESLIDAISTVLVILEK